MAKLENEKNLQVPMPGPEGPIAWRWRDNEYQTWNFVGYEPKHMDYVFVEPLYSHSNETAALTPDEAWEELCSADDRTSPAEYPDHALITRQELAYFMSRADGPSTMPVIAP